MKRLEEKFRKYGRRFEQLCRTENTAIYRQHISDRHKSYEVILIRVAHRRSVKLDGRIRWEECEPYECYPSTEKWGTCGWTYSTEEEARAKYDLISPPCSEPPALPLYPKRAPIADGIVQERVSLSGSINTAEAEQREAA